MKYIEKTLMDQMKVENIKVERSPIHDEEIIDVPVICEIKEEVSELHPSVQSPDLKFESDEEAPSRPQDLTCSTAATDQWIHTDNKINTESLSPTRCQKQVISQPSSSASATNGPIVRNRPKKYNRIDINTKMVLIACVKSGKTVKESAEITGINRNTALGIISEFNKNNGVLVEKNHGGKRHVKVTSELLEEIEKIVEENSLYTLKSISETILMRKNVSLSKSTIENALKKLCITIKCTVTQPELRYSPETIEARQEYALRFPLNAPENRKLIIFIDECCFNCHRRSRRVSKFSKERNASLIAAMNISGIIWHEIVEDSNVNFITFRNFLERLFNRLAESNLEKVWIVLDDASIHCTQDVLELVAQTNNSLVFLPPHSPMLNPAEEVFSAVKFSARNLLADPSVGMNLVEIIQHSVSTVTPENCNNYYLNMYKKLSAAAANEVL